MNQELNPLSVYIVEWLKNRGTTAKWLADKAGIPHSTFTEIKRGRLPRPDTIRRLAEALNVPRGRLYLLAGYLEEEDLMETASRGLSPQEQELLEGFQDLPEEGRLWLLRSLRGMLRYQEGEVQRGGAGGRSSRQED